MKFRQDPSLEWQQTKVVTANLNSYLTLSQEDEFELSGSNCLFQDSLIQHSISTFSLNPNQEEIQNYYTFSNKQGEVGKTGPKLAKIFMEHENGDSESFIQISPQQDQKNMPKNKFPQPPNPQKEFIRESDEGGKQIKKSKHKDSSRNILCYQVKKSIEKVFHLYRCKLKLKCIQFQVQFQDLLAFYSLYENKTYIGPEIIAQMLRITEQTPQYEAKMKKIFYPFFEKVLRRQYLISSLKYGKMDDIRPYIEQKNGILLYFIENI